MINPDDITIVEIRRRLEIETRLFRESLGCDLALATVNLWRSALIVNIAKRAQCFKPTHIELALAIEMITISFAIHAKVSDGLGIGQREIDARRILIGDYYLTRAAKVVLNCESMGAIGAVAQIMTSTTTGHIASLVQGDPSPSGLARHNPDFALSVRNVIDACIRGALAEGGKPTVLGRRQSSLTRALSLDRMLSRELERTDDGDSRWQRCRHDRSDGVHAELVARVEMARQRATLRAEAIMTAMEQSARQTAL